MFPILKIAALSAALAAGFVALSEAPVRASAPTGAKVFYDRVGDPTGSVQRVSFANAADAARVAPVVNRAAKGNVAAATLPCEQQAWPYKAAECLTAADGAAARKPVRTIAINAVR